jgi:hypothetical protein
MGNKVPRFVIITKGPYKGYPGFYKGKRAGKLVIELSTGNKEALVDRDSIIAQDSNHEMIDVSPRSAQSDDIVLASPVKFMATSKSPGSKSPRRTISMPKSGSIKSDDIAASIEKFFNSSRKSSKSSNKMVAKAYVEGRVFEKNYIDNEYSVIFRDFLEKIGQQYSTDVINAHLTVLKSIEGDSEGSFQKRTRKLFVVAYMFVIFNQTGINVPYNPTYSDIIRPNDNPEYILAVASKVNYIRDVTVSEFQGVISKVIDALQKLTNNPSMRIIPSQVYNRVQSPIQPRTRKPIRVSLSPLRLNNYNKNLDSEATVFALKKFRETVNHEVKTSVLSEGFKTALQIMTDNVDKPQYILGLKDNKIDFSKELLPWYNFFMFVHKYYKDHHELMTKNIVRPYSNKVLYNKIKEIQVSHLQKGIPTFSPQEYKDILSYLVTNYDTIVSLPHFAIRFKEEAVKLYSNQNIKLQDEAVITLNLKVSHMYNRNISYKM